MENIKLLDVCDVVREYVLEYYNSHTNIDFLEIGAHPKVAHTSKLVKEIDVKYTNMDIEPATNIPESIVGNICSCPEIPDESYDIVYSHNVFEHIKTPWIAAEECVRITKGGGLNIHIAPFSYEYHAYPVDCFRYTHTGFKSMFEISGSVEEIISGYQDVSKRKSINKQIWLDNWLVLYVGRKK